MEGLRSSRVRRQKSFSRGPENLEPRLVLSLVTGLTGYWQFNGNGADSSGAHNDVQVTPYTTYAASVIGQGMSLTGKASQYAVRPVSDAIYDFGSSNFTVQAWVNYNSTANEQTLVEKFGGNGTDNGWTLTKLSTNVVRFYDSNGTAQIDTNVLTITAHQWHQVVARNIGGTLTIFFDGASQVSGLLNGPITPSVNPLLIGVREASHSQPYYTNGLMDEVGIWNRGLSDAEVLSLYNTRNAVNLQPQVAAAAPVIAGVPATQTYTGGSLAGAATLTDPQNDVTNSTLAVQMTGAMPTDRVIIQNQGTGAGQVGVSGNTVTYAGTTIGTFSGGVGIAPVQITFNASATVANVQAVIRDITYSSAARPSIGPRSISFQLTDNTGVLGAANTTLTVNSGAAPQLVDLATNPTSSDPANFISFNSALYFSAYNPADQRRELYKSDGTAAGTVSLSAYNPGPIDPTQFTIVSGVLYFVAQNSQDTQYGLWKSDGTVTGTSMVSDYYTPPSGLTAGPSSIANLSAMSGSLYFSAANQDDGGSTELWKSNGTAAGTVPVLTGATAPQNPGLLTNSSGTLLFEALNQADATYELWKSNGVAAGTSVVKTVAAGGPNASFADFSFAVVGSQTYLTGYYPTTGNSELWKTDGTAANTTVILPSTSAGPSGPTNLMGVSGTLYFSDGQGLWKSNGVAAGTVIVKPSLSSMSQFTNLNGTLIFKGDDGTGPELWKSSGTAATTALVEAPGAVFSSDPTQITNVGGTLYFVAFDDNGPTGYELWKSDGTAANTTLVSDITPGPNSTPIGNITGVNGAVYFSANTAGTGNELWKTNGTAAGTALVKDINTNTPGSNPNQGFLTINGWTYFGTYNNQDGTTALYKSNGTPAGTTLVANNLPSQPLSLTNVSGTLYFVSGSELYKSDGTAAGTVPVDGNVGSTSPSQLVNVNGTLYFQAFNQAGPGRGAELWKSNGTAVGTVMIKDIYPGGTSSSPTNLFNDNGLLLFTANDPSNNSELWKSDGTTAGTVVVKTVAANGPIGANSFTFANNVLYFVGGNPADAVTSELWTTNGTAAGTTVVKNLAAGGPYNLGSLVNYNGQLYFQATNPADGAVELWKSDGTAPNTLPVVLYGSGGPGTPQFLTPMNGKLYFEAFSQVDNANELWSSDGTTASVVAPRTSGGPINPIQLTNVNNTLYFIGTNAANGQELWSSDGTLGGTAMVQDLTNFRDFNNNVQNSNVDSLFNANGTLFFMANDKTHGAELYIVGNPPPQLANVPVSLAPTTLPVLIAPAATVTDPDGDFPNSTLTVAVTNAEANDRLSILNGGGVTAAGSSVSYNSVVVGTVAGGTGVTPLVVSFNGAATAAALQAVLDQVAYSSAATPGAFNRTVSIQMADGGNSAAPASIVTLVANSPPTNSLPAPQTVNEDTALVFSSANANAITVGDPDAGSNPLQVTLTAANGTLTLGSTAGLSVSGNGTGSVTASGTIANLNVGLNGLSFLGTLNFNGPTSIGIQTSDLGNTGLGGAIITSGSVNITVNAVNDPPTIAAPSAQQTAEDTPLSLTPSTAFAFNDVDSASAQLIVTFTATNGSLTYGGGSSFTSASYVGTSAVLNSLSLVFTPNANYNGAATIQVTLDDQGNTGSGGPLTASRTVNINVTAVNDPPVQTLPAPQTANEDVALVFSTANGNPISIADVDGGSSPEQVTLTSANGALTLAGTANLSVSGNGTGTVIATGALVDINNALNGLSFLPSSNFNGSTSVQVSTNDQGNTGSGGPLTANGNIPVSVNAINDAPVNSLPPTQTGQVGVALVLSSANGNLISISDVDAGSSQVQVTLNGLNGNLTLAGTTGLTFIQGTGSNEPHVTVRGTISDINTALNGLRYVPVAGAASYSIQVITNDLGNTGLGGPAVASNVLTINVSQPPAIAGVTSPVTYAVGSPATVIAPSGSVNDSTGGYANGKLTVTITNGGGYDKLGIQSAGSLSVGSGTISYGGTQIATFTSGTGTTPLVITFLNNASVTQTSVNAVLDNVTYVNTNASATIFDRTVTYQFSNGSNSTSSTVNQTVHLVQASVSITGFGTTVNYTRGTAAIVLAANGAAANDANNAWLNSKFTLTTINGGQADKLSVQTNGLLVVTGSSISYNGNAVATFTGGIGTTPLVVQFNNTGTQSAMQTAVQAVLANITYVNTNAAASIYDRAVNVTFTDGTNASSPTIQKAVHMQ